MSGELQVKASVDTAEVLVLASPEVLSEFTRLTRPYIEVTAHDGPAAGCPAVLVCDTPPSDGEWRRVALSSEYEPDRVLWVDDERHRIALVGEHSAWGIQQLLRSVRHLLRWQEYAHGDLFLHGGLVRVDGLGIAFLGQKRSGKTSSVLSALLHGQADFISNDDVVITDTGSDARLTGYGSPRSINIRTDSLLALARSVPGLTSLLSDASHPTNSFQGRHHTVEAVTTESGAALPGSIWVRCGELARATGRALVAEHAVDAVVLPRFDDSADGPRLTRLDPRPAGRELLAHVEHSATKYDPFLAAWFPDTAQDRREHLIERLVDEIPFFRLTQNMHRLSDATALMLDTLTRAHTAGAPHHDAFARGVSGT